MGLRLGAIRDYIFVVLVMFVLLVLLTRGLDFSKMWCFVDLLPLSQISQKYGEMAFIWLKDGLGGLNTPMTNAVRFEYLIQLVTVNPVVAQKILCFLPFFVGGLSMFFLSRRLGVSLTTSVVASIFFVFNPFTLSLFIIGETGTMMTLFIFPAVFYLMCKFFDDGKYRDLALFGVLYFIFVWNLYFFAWLFVGGIVFIIFLRIGKFFNRERLQMNIDLKKVGGFSFKLGIMVALILLLSLQSIIVLYNVNSSTGGVLGGTVLQETTKNYQDVSILSLIRLAGDYGSPQNAGYLNYNMLNGYTIWGDLLFLIPVVALIFVQKVPRYNKFMKVSIILLFLTICSMLFIKSFPELTVSIPIFYTLRSPAEMLALLCFLYIITFAISLDILRNLFGSRKGLMAKILMILLFVSIIGGIFTYNAPFMDGTLGVKNMQGSYFIGNPYYVEDRYYQLPSILSSLDKNFQNYNVLVLPWERFEHNKISRVIPNYFGMSHGTAAIQDASGLLEVFKMSIVPADTANVLADYNVKFVVIDKNFISMFQEKGINAFMDNFMMVWLTGDPNNFIKLYLESDMQMVYNDDNFVIFSNPALTKPINIFSSPETELNYTEINPTQWTAKLSANGSINLVLTQMYNPSWEVNVYQEGTLIETVKSHPFNGVLNDFFINGTNGNIDLEIKFQPQSYFDTAFSFSIIIFCMCGVILALSINEPAKGPVSNASNKSLEL
jgi:hypothetical protein